MFICQVHLYGNPGILQHRLKVFYSLFGKTEQGEATLPSRMLFVYGYRFNFIECNHFKLPEELIGIDDTAFPFSERKTATVPGISQVSGKKISY